jgi:ABC-2 type transport system permease protein
MTSTLVTPPVVATQPRRGRRLTAVAPFVGRSLIHSLRDAEALLMAVLLPTMVMLLFVTVFGGAIQLPGIDYVDYIVPGVIVLCAGFGSSSVAVYVATDIQHGIVDRFRTMPVPAYGVVVGHVVAGVLRNLVATAFVIGIGVLLGFRPAATPWQWLATIGLLLAFIVAITWLFAAIGLASSGPAAANSYGFVLLFLPYLSSGFVPIDTLPAWLAPVAEHQPITLVIEATRALLAGHAPGADAYGALAWCAGVIAVALVWSAWMFRRRAARR